MGTLVSKLRQDYPGLVFTQSSVASWSPQSRQIFYSNSRKTRDVWSLLHELGHALLGHNSYESDVELLHKELAAWHKASDVGKKYGILIDEEHIQNCLDTYRDWLHKRSSCPDCQKHGLQQSKGLYNCLNCRATWKVSSERFCRPYRLKNA